MVAIDVPLTASLSMGVLASWLLYTYLKPKPNYPPGPRGLPLIGSLLEINNERPWITYSKWAAQYGKYFTSPKLTITITIHQNNNHNLTLPQAT
jgi:hypothetical protein